MQLGMQMMANAIVMLEKRMMDKVDAGIYHVLQVNLGALVTFVKLVLKIIIL